VLELKNVCAGYDGVEVLHDINCAFPTGSCWCVLGPNGCGKTTLLRAMAGLIPHRGQVLLDDREIGGMKRRELAGRIAVFSQINTVYFPYTVYDTVMLGRYQHMRGALFGGPSPEDRAMVERCLEFTGLSNLRRRGLDELSGGQRQRVFLAQTLAQDPQTILLDEPTNHLDVKYQVELVDYLRD
jgi:iron complex transport system ATP-binding protein